MSTVAPISAFVPFDTLAKTFTARLRGRMHVQSLVSTADETFKKRRTAHGVMVESRIHELSQLQEQHMKTFDPILRSKALNILQTLPIMAVDEDLHLRFARQALRLVVHFNASHLPIAFNLLNHFTRHSYVLEGFGLYQITLCLRDFNHPQCKEALELLLPRMCATVQELTPWEGALMMYTLHDFNITNAAFEDGVLEIISNTFKYIPVRECTMCVMALRYVSECSKSIAFLRQRHIQESLCDVLSEATLQFNAYKEEIVFGSMQRMNKSISDNNSANNNNNSNSNNSNRDSKVEYQDEASVQRRQEAKQREEYRQAVYANLLETRFLIRELTITFSTIHYAPRRVMNELIKAAFAWNDQFSLSLTTTQNCYDNNNNNNNKDNNNDDDLKVHFQEEFAKDTQELRSQIPRLSRHDLCNIIYAFRRTSYGDEKALLQLSSRVASLRDEKEEKRLEELYGRCNQSNNSNNSRKRNDNDNDDDGNTAKEELQRYLCQRDNLSQPLVKVVDATKIIETLAYFQMRESIAIIDALVEEVVQLMTTSPTSEFRRSRYRNTLTNNDDMSESGNDGIRNNSSSSNSSNRNKRLHTTNTTEGSRSSTSGVLWTLTRLIMSLTRLHYLAFSSHQTSSVANLYEELSEEEQQQQRLRCAERMSYVYKLITCPVIYDYIALPNASAVNIKLTSSLLRGMIEISAELFDALEKEKLANAQGRLSAHDSLASKANISLPQDANTKCVDADVMGLIRRICLPWNIIKALMKVVLMQPSNVYVSAVIECMTLIQSNAIFYSVMSHHLPVKEFESKFMTSMHKSNR